jgi:fluoroquinolone resistance protein
VAEREHGLAAPVPASEISHEDWDGRDLSSQRWTAVALVDVDLTETTGSGAVFTDSTFRDCTFNGAAYSAAAFTGCTFVNCSFFGVTFAGCKLVGSRFDRCRYDLLTVSEGDWSFVGLPGADLRGTTFSDLRMREADLTKARCQKATFRNVDLSGSWLDAADLTGCDLRGSDLSALDPASTTIRSAVIDVQQALVIASGLGFVLHPLD